MMSIKQNEADDDKKWNRSNLEESSKRVYGMNMINDEMLELVFIFQGLQLLKMTNFG